jgi:hypothetical protein
MNTNSWFKFYDHDHDVTDLAIKARSYMIPENLKIWNYDHGLLETGSNFWFKKTLDTMPDFEKILLEIENRISVPLISPDTYIGFWEYTEHGKLPIHTDNGQLAESQTVLLPLEGGFKTYLHADNDSIIDSVIYYPGCFGILNNTKYKHSGETISGHRLVLTLMISPEYSVIDSFDNIKDNSK